jgi:hypothetical protein
MDDGPNKEEEKDAQKENFGSGTTHGGKAWHVTTLTASGPGISRQRTTHQYQDHGEPTFGGSSCTEQITPGYDRDFMDDGHDHIK